jgi:hypothetical protein
MLPPKVTLVRAGCDEVRGLTADAPSPDCIAQPRRYRFKTYEGPPQIYTVRLS